MTTELKSHPFARWQLSPREAWWSVMFAAAFNVVGLAMRSFGTPIPVDARWAQWASMAGGIIIIAMLLWRRSAPSRGTTNYLFVANALLVTAGLFVIEKSTVGAVAGWIPFRPNELGCMVAALLAPSFLAGLLAILVHAGGSMLLLFLLPADIRLALTGGEPLATVAFATAGVFVLVFRFRQVAIRDRILEVEAEARRVRELAHSFLQIRDLMNTPLQTLEVTLAWLTDDRKAEKSVVDAAQQAIDQLRKLNSELRRFEGEGEWQPAVPPLGPDSR